MNALKVYMLSGIFLILAGCTDEDESQQNRDIDGIEFLESAEFLATISQSESQTIIRNTSELSGLGMVPETDINVYRVSYPTTQFDGTALLASGLVLLPIGQSYPILSYQHGTILEQRETPSAFDRSNTLVKLLIAFASTGYSVSASDYIGYGMSEEFEHPFEHRITQGQSSLDMLRATRELRELLDISQNTKLFLAGYSQGGYVTMALHQEIEQQTNWQVDMSAPGAGAYNKSGTVAALFEEDIELENPGAWIWNLDVINRTSKVNRPWMEILQEPALSTVTSINDPMLFPTLNSLPKDPQQLFKSAFINGLADGTDTQMLQALRDNDTHNWSPSGPITLYFGTEDQSVFPFHATSAFENMSQQSERIDLVAFDGLNHSSAVIPYWRSIFELFQSLK